MKKLLLSLVAVTAIGFSAAAVAGYDHGILNPEVVGATSVASLPATCRLLADDVTNMRPIFIDCDDVVGLESAVTASDTEINYLDIATLGTGAASKAVVLDASSDYTYPAAATIRYASGGTLQVNSTDGAVISAIRTGTDTDLDNGQTSEVVTVTGATASSLCFATITIDPTNDVAVSSVVAAANQATVTVTGDPGATGADLAVVCYN